MKDGEIWALEYIVKGKWLYLGRYATKKAVKASIGLRAAMQAYSKDSYRVVKYVRQTKTGEP